MKTSGFRRILLPFLVAFSAAVFLLAGGCGPGVKEENEKLKKEISLLSADNDRLKSEIGKLRGDASTLHSQMADLNMQIANLQTQNQGLQNELDNLKDQLKTRKR